MTTTQTQDYLQYKSAEDKAKQYVIDAQNIVRGKLRPHIQADHIAMASLRSAIASAREYGHEAEVLRTNFTKKWKNSNFDGHSQSAANHAKAVTWIDENIFQVVEKIEKEYL